MKIYTFHAPSNTNVELLWSLRQKDRDAAYDKFISQARYVEVASIKDCDLAIFSRKAFDPNTLILDRSVFDAVREAETYGKPLIVDATCDSDSVLEIPKASVLRFGLYKSLKRYYETERPYWSNQKTKAQLESLPIPPRSKKPSISFCGTTSSKGRFFKIGKNLPISIVKTILSQGSLSRKFDIRLKKGMSHKLREVAMQLLALDERVDCNFDVTNNLQDYYNPANPNRVNLETKFIENINKCDYALDVRANGNYSGRFYMALNAGRIPLVIDTDRVFPFEEKIHMLRVPVNSLHKISDIVLNHFETTTDKEFVEMKMENRDIYNKLIAPDKYIPNFIESVLKEKS